MQRLEMDISCITGTNIVSQMCTTEVFVVVNVVFIALHDLYTVPT